jgi:hypothetical protein
VIWGVRVLSKIKALHGRSVGRARERKERRAQRRQEREATRRRMEEHSRRKARMDEEWEEL